MMFKVSINKIFALRSPIWDIFDILLTLADIAKINIVFENKNIAMCSF